MTDPLSRRTLTEEAAWHEGYAFALKQSVSTQQASIATIAGKIEDIRREFAERGQPVKPEWYVRVMAVIDGEKNEQPRLRHPDEPSS